MMQEQEASLKTLQDIRSMMEQSARFISLSGWSGVWAGGVALGGSLIARNWLKGLPVGYDAAEEGVSAGRFVLLAIAVFIIALAGAYYFTWKKTREQGGKIANGASKRMAAQIAIPMIAGAVFALHFLYAGLEDYITPSCLAFYGLALINGSKYTLSDIRYLGLCIVGLGCINLFLPEYGLTFWATGFGVLHILYGIIMWNRYDKPFSREGR
jgi:hypothetical protein